MVLCQHVTDLIILIHPNPVLSFFLSTRVTLAFNCLQLFGSPTAAPTRSIIADLGSIVLRLIIKRSHPNSSYYVSGSTV